MRIKKFTCINCGAPKVNEYKSPYIMCDYCGSFTDIDFTLGMNFWNQTPLKTLGYEFNKIAYAQRMQYALQKNDRSRYWELQHGYWDYYYRTYPAYLPPSIDTGEKYATYLKVCANSSTNSAFNPSNGEIQMKMQQLQQSVTYDYSKGSPKANGDSFFLMAEYFINITKEGFKDFYNDPQYEIMNELLPQSVHLKMKLSMFVQAWLPYLTEGDITKLLKMTGFSLDYVEIKQPPGKMGNCENCKAEIYIPDGSYRVFCEKCRKTTRVLSVFKCSSCGAENDVPDNPSKPVVCQYCGVENRLIKPLFG